MLLMTEARVRKCVQIPTMMTGEFNRQAEGLRARGVRIGDSEMVGAALMAYWRMSAAEQLDWLRRSRNFDLELMEQAEADQAAELADEAVKTEGQPAGGRRGRKRA